MEFVKIGLSSRRIKNLTTLAQFLERRIKPPTFNMGSYIKIGQGFDVEFPTTMKEALAEIAVRLDIKKVNEATLYNYCGTAACAVGHGPLAGIPIKKNEDFAEYSSRVFIDDIDSDDHALAWQFLFASSWVNIDNTPKGAAARIWLLLDKGLPKVKYSRFEYSTNTQVYKSYKKGNKNHPDKRKDIAA